jgi:hypothetical protein
MKRTFGKFKNTEYQTGGSVFADPESQTGDVSLPPIMGSPLPSSGVKNRTMGEVFPDKETPSPKLYAEQVASKKRMKKMPSASPLGPITGGLSSAAPPASGEAPQQGSGIPVGDQWMGEIWNQLTPGTTVQDQEQGLRGLGYANGGSVGDLMSVYNQTMSELESGGIGYAGGGAVDQSREIASMGRGGDSMIMHINPAELQGLQSLLGPVSVNPNTGNPEAFPWLPLLGLIGGTVGAGAMSDWEAGPMVMGGLAGLTMGMGFGGAGAAAAEVPAKAMAAFTQNVGANVAKTALPAVLEASTPALAGGTSALASTASTVAPEAALAATTVPSAGASGLPGMLGEIDGGKALKAGLQMANQAGQPRQQVPASPIGLDEPPRRPPSQGQIAQGRQIARPPRRRRGRAGRIGSVLA